MQQSLSALGQSSPAPPPGASNSDVELFLSHCGQPTDEIGSTPEHRVLNYHDFVAIFDHKHNDRFASAVTAQNSYFNITDAQNEIPCLKNMSIASPSTINTSEIPAATATPLFTLAGIILVLAAALLANAKRRSQRPATK